MHDRDAASRQIGYPSKPEVEMLSNQRSTAREAAAAQHDVSREKDAAHETVDSPRASRFADKDPFTQQHTRTAHHKAKTLTEHVNGQGEQVAQNCKKTQLSSENHSERAIIMRARAN